MVSATVTHPLTASAPAGSPGGREQHTALSASSAGLMLAATLLAYRLAGKQRRRGLWKRLGRFGDWLDRHGPVLIWIGLIALAMLIAALLGASLLWVILTGVFTMIGFALLVLLAFILFGGERPGPMRSPYESGRSS